MFLIFNGHKGIQFCLGDFKSTKNWQISTILTKMKTFVSKDVFWYHKRFKFISKCFGK